MARRKQPTIAAPGGMPAELSQPLHPVWRDADALAAHPTLGRYLNPAATARAEMGGSMYHHIVGRWARDHGYAHPLYPAMTDWHRLRADLSA